MDGLTLPVPILVGLDLFVAGVNTDSLIHALFVTRQSAIWEVGQIQLKRFGTQSHISHASTL
jgi:hypothetical protein